MIGQLKYVLNKKQRVQCMMLFLLFILTATLETLGVSVVIPFILSMLSPDTLRENKYIMQISDVFHLDNDVKLIFFTAILIILIYIIKNVIVILANYIQAKVRNTIEKDLSILMMKSYLKHPYAYFLNVNSSEIIRGVHEDTISIAEIIDAFSGLVAEILTCLLIGIFLVVLSPLLAVGVLAIALLTALSIILIFKKKTSICGEKSRENYLKKYQYLYQSITGIKEVIVMQRRENFIKKYSDVAASACKYNTTYKCIAKMPSRIIETVFIGSLLLLVCFSMGNTSDTTLLITQLGAMAVAAVRVLPSISNITNSTNTLIYHRPALESAYLNLKSVEKENIDDCVLQLEEKKDIKFENCLEIKDVMWQYYGNTKMILNKLNMSIHKGESVAFIGESGAGKTTLADIVLGLLHPQNGNILVDGTDIYDIPKTWSTIIGYVPQNVFMIDEPIKNNVAFGIEEENININHVWKALEQAQLKEFVESLPQKLDTVMGERGVKVSGGQRQRIAIARALYNDPDILVLDEATSALDTETENAVMEAIDALQGHKTLIIVAHRLSTIRNCDKIYEIKDGQAVVISKEDIFNEKN